MKNFVIAMLISTAAADAMPACMPGEKWNGKYCEAMANAKDMMQPPADMMQPPASL